MIEVIAHRANIAGPDPKYENTVGKIMYALNRGYSVEIDVWLDKDKSCILLGHDRPIMNQSVPESFLENPKIFCHAKSMDALLHLQQNPNVCVFWQTDESKINLTSRGHLWMNSICTFDMYHSKSIVTFLGKREDFHPPKYNFFGICTDYPETYGDFNV